MDILRKLGLPFIALCSVTIVTLLHFGAHPIIAGLLALIAIIFKKERFEIDEEESRLYMEMCGDLWEEVYAAMENNVPVGQFRAKGFYPDLPRVVTTQLVYQEMVRIKGLTRAWGDLGREIGAGLVDIAILNITEDLS